MPNCHPNLTTMSAPDLYVKLLFQIKAPAHFILFQEVDLESYPETNCYYSRVSGDLVDKEKELCVGYKPEGATVALFTRKSVNSFKYEKVFRYKSFDFYGYKVK